MKKVLKSPCMIKKKLLGNCIKKKLKNKIYTSKVDTVKWFFPMIASSNIKVLL